MAFIDLFLLRKLSLIYILLSQYLWIIKILKLLEPNKLHTKTIINYQVFDMKRTITIIFSLLFMLTSSSLSYAASVSAKKKHRIDKNFNRFLDAKKPTNLASEETDQFIINYKNATDGNKAAQRLAKKLKRKIKHHRKLGNKKHVFKLRKKLKKHLQKTVMASMKLNSDVASVEADPIRFQAADNRPWGINKVQAHLLQDNSASNMTVCIIDSGYDVNNPDLSLNNVDGHYDAGTGSWYQVSDSHGTHVAGIIAAVNNNQGIMGVLPNTKVNIHIVKAFNNSSWGYSSDLIDAVNNCVSNGAKVVNMSLGGPDSSTAERNAFQSIANQGVLLVASAGNYGTTSLNYPASYDSVISVGAVDENNQHTVFSQYNSKVELAAPGEAILSTVAGDGRRGFITVGNSQYGDAVGVVPHQRYTYSNGWNRTDLSGTAQGQLKHCTRSGSTYSCGNMYNKICIAERHANQSGSSYPEINAAQACADAGAAGIIIYSNASRPGLQNPFLVDPYSDVRVPTVTVNRTVGQQLLSKTGQNTTVQVLNNQNYDYYNGTSMSAPHVSAAAALVWSNNIDCSANEVRQALTDTALDIGASGKDSRTGYGLVQSKAAADLLASTCGAPATPPPPPPSNNVLANGVPETGISGVANGTVSFTMEVPEGATDLSFVITGGSGDADLYVKFGSEPTLSSFDCRPYINGNEETCTISNVQAGTYYINLVGYQNFSNITLTGSFTQPSSNPGWAGNITNQSGSQNGWKYYSVEVPEGMKTLTIGTSKGTGDVDLYVRLGSRPNASSYDCRPYVDGNVETCTINNPAPGKWYFGLYGYRAFSGVQIDVEYRP